MSNMPYVVSADIHGLLEDWANRTGLALPGQRFFSELRHGFITLFRQIFEGFELVEETDLRSGLRELVHASGLHPVSLDRAYYPTAVNLELARLVDRNNQDTGTGPRPGCPPIWAQYARLQALNLTKVCLVDDVVYSGSLLLQVVRKLSTLGIDVPQVVIGIGIDEGIAKLERAGCEVSCVRRYADVIDEICERDFYPGVPLSGRLLSGAGNTGVPYILPFGDPGAWASIPARYHASVSSSCIKLTIRLFTEIERLSSRIVRCCDLGRRVVGLPNDHTRYVDTLTKFAT